MDSNFDEILLIENCADYMKYTIEKVETIEYLEMTLTNRGKQSCMW